MSDQSPPPERYYQQHPPTTTDPAAQYQPYRPQQQPESSHTGTTEYQPLPAQHQAPKPQTAPYPEDEYNAPSPPGGGYRPYKPYASGALPNPEPNQLPSITVQEPTPITPSSSLRRRPDGFPVVENQGGQPIDMHSGPDHAAPTYTLPERTHEQSQDYATATVSELPSEPERSHGVPSVAVAPPPPVQEDDDDLYSVNVPPPPPGPPPPRVPEKSPERQGRPTSSALPLYDHPEGVSLEHEPVQGEKAPQKTAHFAEDGPSEIPPPAYSQPEGVSIESGAAAAAAGKAAQPADQKPYVPQDYGFYQPEKAPLPGQAGFVGSPSGSAPNRPIPETPPALPPRRSPIPFGVDDDPNNPVHYTRDPHKLIAYLIPFPKPKGHDTNLPDRFLIYTPPPPPFPKPAEGEKESRSIKVQRKWQDEVRAAKTSEAKAASWAGLRKNATKAVAWGMDKTVSANLEFLTRMHPDSMNRGRSPSPGASKAQDKEWDIHTDDGIKEADTTEKTVGLEEMVLIYPSTVPMSPDQIRTEFINTMLRSQSKAQRDSILATGLLPITLAVDILSTPIWPFGGLFEVDAVWAYASIRGARIARSTTKRLTSTGTTQDPNKDTLHIRFTPAARLDILRRYLAMKCHERNPKRFPSAGVNVTESEVLEAIGWSPSQVKEGERNWEDEQWELTSVKDDLRAVMGKGAREWNKWVGKWEEDPKKAAKK